MKKSPVIKAITVTIAALTLFSAAVFPAAAAQPYDKTEISGNAQINFNENTENNETDIPSSYSSVDLNIVTPPKNQKYNDCWTFSSLSVLETKLLKSGFNVTGFSAEHMNLWATTKSNGTGWQRSIISDGYAFTSLGYISSWQGGIEQSDYDSLIEKYTPDTDLSSFVNYGATAIKYLDDFTQSEIKKEIIKNGSIYAAYSHSPNYENSDRTAYFCPEGSPKATGHAIAVVGWDDNYSKNNFKAINGVLPKNDGAWLVKNSWGNYNTLNGYFWLSFEDSYLFSSTFKFNFAIEDVTEITNEIRLMQNEIYGATYEFNYVEDDSVTYLNLFNFSEGYNSLDSVIFETTSKNSDYEIYYVPAENKIPVADETKWTLLNSGVIPYNGYVNINADNFDLPVTYGAIAVKISKNEQSDKNTIGVGEWLNKSNGQFAFINDSHKGDSFIYKNGNMTDLLDWYKNERDDSLGGTFVIKAITNKTEVSVTMLGDIDLNNQLDVLDVTDLQLAISESATLSAVQKLNADTDSNGEININDVTRLQIMISENS